MRHSFIVNDPTINVITGHQLELGGNNYWHRYHVCLTYNHTLVGHWFSVYIRFGNWKHDIGVEISID